MKLCVEQNYLSQFLDATLNMSIVLACQWRRHLNGANWLEQINIWSLSGRAKPSWLASYLSYLLRQEGVPWSEAVKLWLKSGDLWLLFASHCYSLVLLRDFPTVLDTFNYLYSTQGVRVRFWMYVIEITTLAFFLVFLSPDLRLHCRSFL